MIKPGIVEIEIHLTFLVIILMHLSRVYIKRLITRYVNVDGYSLPGKASTMKFFNFSVVIIGAVLISLIWVLSFKGLSINFISLFTLLGVAFFANMLILSKITTSLILIFNNPFKIGDIICICENVHSKYGKEIKIGLFNIMQLADSYELIIYSNKIAIQEPQIEKEVLVIQSVFITP